MFYNVQYNGIPLRSTVKTSLHSMSIYMLANIDLMMVM